MKRIFLIALALVSGICSAQTFTVNNLAVNGTSSHTGAATFSIRPTFNGNTPWDSGNFNPSSYATLASPALTGAPTAPTQATGINNTTLATTAYVANSQICPSIMDHGGDKTGVSDNTAAFFSTAAASPSGQVCVSFPAGTFKFNSALSYTNPAAPSSILIKGAGQDVTTLVFANSTSGINIVSNAPGSSAHIRDLTVATAQAAGGNAGIALTQTSSLNQFSMSDIYNVTLRGNDNTGTGGSHYWSYGILINGQDSVNVESVTVYGNGGAGVGLQCQGNGVQYAIYVNISKSVFNGLGTGVVYSSYCQGMTITQSNFQNDSIGFMVPSGAAGVLAQLQISDSQFQTSSDGINIQTNVGGTMIHDNDIFVPVNHSGIFIANTNGGTIHGNTINTDGTGTAGTSGIVLGSGAQTFVIMGNQIGGVASCIQYQAGSSFNQNLGNALACTTAVIDNGTSNTKGVATN